MKRILFQLLNLLMACVVLLSSTGFGLVEHSCQMRGKKKTMVIAFSDVKAQRGCAADQPTIPTNQTVLKKTECCQDDQQYENVDTSSSLSQYVAKFVKVITETILAGALTVLAWVIDWIFGEKSVSIAVLPSPPAPSGRDLLTLLRSFLI